MGKTYAITSEEMNEIKEYRRMIKNKDIDKRLYAVQLRGEGMKNAEIADKLDTCPEVISNWVGRYKKEGISGLLEHRKGGNNRLMSYEEEEELLQRFYDDAVHGKVVTLREIKAAYEEKTGHKLSTFSQIYKLLHRHNWRKIKPRPKHQKCASEEAIEVSKKLTRL